MKLPCLLNNVNCRMFICPIALQKHFFSRHLTVSLYMHRCMNVFGQTLKENTMHIFDTVFLFVLWKFWYSSSICTFFSITLIQKFYSSRDSQTLLCSFCHWNFWPLSRLCFPVLYEIGFKAEIHSVYTSGFMLSLSNRSQTWNVLCPRTENLLFHIMHS